MVNDQSQTTELDDGFIVPGTIRIPPKRGDDTAWLQISQVTLHNVRSLVNSGKSETADRIMGHYWRRWREWNQQ